MLAVADGVGYDVTAVALASSGCKRRLDWLLVDGFISGLTVIAAIAFTVGLVTFVTKLDGLGGDLFTFAVVEGVFHKLRVSTHDNSTR